MNCVNVRMHGATIKKTYKIKSKFVIGTEIFLCIAYNAAK